MSNRSRGWLKVAAVLSLLTALICLAGGVAITFNVKDINQYIVKALRYFMHGINDADLHFYKVMLVISLGMDMVINLVAAYSYIKVSAHIYPNINEYNVLSVVAVIQFLVGGTLVPGLIVLVIVLRNKHIYDTHEQTIEEREFENLVAQVNYLNKMRREGMVNEQDYQKSLDNMLTMHVLSKDKK